MNCWLNALNYTCCLAMPLQSLCRGPGHLASSLQTVLKFRLPKAGSKKPPFLSVITASDLLSTDLLLVLSPSRYIPSLSWHNLIPGHPAGPWQPSRVLTMSTEYSALTHSAIR